MTLKKGHGLFALPGKEDQPSQVMVMESKPRMFDIFTKRRQIVLPFDEEDWPEISRTTSRQGQSKLSYFYPCNQCDSSFSSRSKSRLHCVKEHQLIKKLLCNACGQCLQSEADLKIHKKTHVRILSCNMCKAKLNKSQLSLHMKQKHKSTIPDIPCKNDSIPEKALSQHNKEDQGRQPKSSQLQHPFVKTRSQARKFKTEKKLKKIFQCDGNDTIPGSDEDTFLDTVHHSVSHFIAQLNSTNGLHQLNHNRFLVRDHDTNGELKPDKPENYVFVRYLPCTTVGGNNARILICLKCDKNASSFISNILEDTVVSQDILEEKNKSCWHVIAVRSKKPNDARDNPENE